MKCLLDLCDWFSHWHLHFSEIKLVKPVTNSNLHLICLFISHMKPSLGLYLQCLLHPSNQQGVLKSPAPDLEGMAASQNLHRNWKVFFLSLQLTNLASFLIMSMNCRLYIGSCLQVLSATQLFPVLCHWTRCPSIFICSLCNTEVCKCTKHSVF